MINPVPQEWLASNFSLQYHLWITYLGHKNKGIDQQVKKSLTVTQILPVGTLGNTLVNSMETMHVDVSV